MSVDWEDMNEKPATSMLKTGGFPRISHNSES
jgi:hypothetical protein